MSAQRFRKKPVEIEAFHYEGGEASAAAIIEWVNQYAPEDDDPAMWYDDNAIQIQTLEGLMLADAGDWILRGVAGEFYPVKPRIFDATYEPAAPIPVNEEGST